MKKVLVLVSMLAILAASVVVSCKKDDPVVKDSIKLNTNTWTASYKGEVVNLTITASGEYSGTPDVDWLSVSGSAITIAPNPFAANRSGNVTFTCGSESATIIVTQEGAGPKEVVCSALDAFIADDFDTFWSYFDLTDAKKAELVALYNEKVESGGMNKMTGYQILSTSMDEATQEATVKVKYSYEESDPSEGDWPLVKKDGKWKIVIDK